MRNSLDTYNLVILLPNPSLSPKIPRLTTRMSGDHLFRFKSLSDSNINLKDLSTLKNFPILARRARLYHRLVLHVILSFFFYSTSPNREKWGWKTVMRQSSKDRNSRFFHSQCVLVSVQYDKSPYKGKDWCLSSKLVNFIFLHQTMRFLIILLYGKKKKRS